MTIETLKNVIAQIESQCLWSDSPYGKYPTKGGDGGDDCLWLGLLTTVNYPRAWDALTWCQDETGLIYRNPNRRTVKNVGFSRDMAMGVLLALSTSGIDNTKKWALAYQWSEWIGNSRPCIKYKPKWMGGGCWLRSPVYKFSPDDRSDITPSGFGLMARVWDGNGWPLTEAMRANKNMDGDWDVAEAGQCPLGYVLHLHALEGYLKRLLNQSPEYAQKLCDTAYKRQSDNLFYKILSQNAVTDDDIARFCEITTYFNGSNDTWLWLQADQGKSISTGDMCGWDLVFLGRLILILKGAL